MTIRSFFAIQVIGLIVCSAMSLAALSEETVQALKPLKLNQAVEDALGNNAGIKNSQLEVGICRDKVAAIRTHFLPTMKFTALGLQLLTPLNFSFDQGVFGDFEEVGPIPAQRTNVSTPERPALFLNAFVAQPILQLIRLRLGAQLGELSKELAIHKLQVQRQQITSQVKHAYYRALEMESTSQVIAATIELYREIQRITSEYAAQKTVLKVDAIEVNHQLANAEYESLKLKNSLTTQKEEINRLLGRNVREDFTLVNLAEPPVLTVSLDAAKDRALAARAEVKQLRTQAKQIDLQSRMKRLEYLPELSVAFDYLSVFGTEVLPRNLVFGGILLNWEPWDWGRRCHEYKEKRKEFQQAQNSMGELQSQIAIEVGDAHRKLQEAKKRMEVMQLGQEVASERLRVLANRYKEQAALLKDVLQAQRDLTQANSQYTQAVIAQWTAGADLEKAIGED